MQDDTIMPVIQSQLDLVVVCDPLHSEYVTEQEAPSIDIPDTDPDISQFRYRHVNHLITSYLTIVRALTPSCRRGRSSMYSYAGPGEDRGAHRPEQEPARA